MPLSQLQINKSIQQIQKAETSKKELIIELNQLFQNKFYQNDNHEDIYSDINNMLRLMETLGYDVSSPQSLMLSMIQLSQINQNIQKTNNQENIHNGLMIALKALTASGHADAAKVIFAKIPGPNQKKISLILKTFLHAVKNEQKTFIQGFASFLKGKTKLTNILIQEAKDQQSVEMVNFIKKTLQPVIKENHNQQKLSDKSISNEQPKIKANNQNIIEQFKQVENSKIENHNHNNYENHREKLISNIINARTKGVVNHINQQLIKTENKILI